MATDSNTETEPDSRMKRYIERVAAGPRMSKNLTEEEAEDALELILNGLVSQVRAAVFLISARMKGESLEENLGYWRALEKTSRKQKVNVPELLQVADPFDGFNRTPYFGFYAIPVIAALGLPCCGHSTRSMPPKQGITFQDVLVERYKVEEDRSLEALAKEMESFGFTYVDLKQSHPKLERLRGLRQEMVKRSTLATFEKMLLSLSADSGQNYLATSYFHPGYEVPMLAVAEESGWQKTILGNGMESTTLFGVMKSSTVYVSEGENSSKELPINVTINCSPDTGKKIQNAYLELKEKKSELDLIVFFGEQALKNASGPAASLIAWQAACLSRLCGYSDTFQDAYDAAWALLEKGTCYQTLLDFIDNGRTANAS